MSILTDINSKLTAAGVRKNTPQAALWFKQHVKDLAINREELLRDENLEATKDIMPGMMFMYMYDAKHKSTLPYWDRFPLIIMVDGAPGGFYGLNLHYLSPMIRFKFLKDLTYTLSDRRYDEKTRFKITFNMLKKVSRFKEFEPCYHHYLTKHIKSRVVKVPASEWDSVVYLPTEEFVGASKGQVWAESMKRIK